MIWENRKNIEEVTLQSFEERRAILAQWFQGAGTAPRFAEPQGGGLFRGLGRRPQACRLILRKPWSFAKQSEFPAGASANRAAVPAPIPSCHPKNKVDGFVKSPSAALRCNFVVAGHPSVLTPPVFARLASGAFYETIILLTYYEIIKVLSKGRQAIRKD